MKILFFIVVLFSAMGLLVTQRIPLIMTALLTMGALYIGGLTTLEQTLAGFSNPAVITIGSMFVLSAGLIKTGALYSLTYRLEAWSKGKKWRLMVILAVFLTLASAFVNNTPVVIMMVPITFTLCRKMKMAPSKWFIPLSYFSIIGGTCTLIGTSTNLIIDGIYRDHGGTGLNLFDFLPLGLVFFVIGLIYVLLFSDRMLPNREPLITLLTREDSSYALEVIVHSNSPLIGQKVGSALAQLGKMRFLELVRDEILYPKDKAINLAFEENDALILEGDPEELGKLLSGKLASLSTVVEDEKRVPVTTFNLSLVEIAVTPGSSFIGHRVQELGLHRIYGVKVLAVQREGRRHRYELRGFRIKAGDIILVQADKQRIESLRQSGNVVIMEQGRPKLKPTKKAKLALGIMAAVVLGAIFTPIPISILAFFGVFLMVQTHCLQLNDAIHALDFNVLFVLIGTLPLGLALEQTGMIHAGIDWLSRHGGELNPVMVISLLYLATNLLSAVLSNTAVAVLLTPVALTLAEQMGFDSKPFLMTVAFGSSLSLITPIGYQTNIIVMGPGAYRFKDFMIFGLPLTIVFWLTATLLIPWFWPL